MDPVNKQGGLIDFRSHSRSFKLTMPHTTGTAIGSSFLSTSNKGIGSALDGHETLRAGKGG